MQGSTWQNLHRNNQKQLSKFNLINSTDDLFHFCEIFNFQKQVGSAAG